MSDKVFLGEDGFIYHIYEGDQTAETMEMAIALITELIRKLRNGQKPVKVIGDYTRIGKANMAARKVANDALKHMDYDKIALFGTSVFHKMIANFIIKITGQAAKAQVFNTAAEAKRWLNS